MSHRLGRVVSDLSHGKNRKATDHGNHHRSTSNDRNSSNVAAGKSNNQRLSLLFTNVSAWRRSDGTVETSRAKSKKQQAKGANSSKRRGLDIGQTVSKYLSMVEQLFTSSLSGGRKTDGPEQRRRTHTFTSSRGCSNKAPSKRHKGRLSSAPASLRGSPENSGHLSVLGESVKMSTSSELSTMEELQSAIQAAIVHCKSSVAVAKEAAAGDDRCKC